MRDFAWIVPSHGGRLETFANFYNSFKTFAVGLELYCVVSNQLDEKLFRARFPDLRILNFQRELQGLPTEGVVNHKKLLGLLALRKNYRRLAVTDDDAVLIRNVPSSFSKGSGMIAWAFTRSNPKIYAISNSPSTLISDRADLEAMKEFAQWYGWFSNPPIYEGEYLDEFFSWIGVHDATDLHRIGWEHFDYVCYQAFFRCRHEEAFFERSGFLPNVRLKHSASLWERPPSNLSEIRALVADRRRRKVYWNVGSPILAPRTSFIRFHVDRNFMTELPGYAFLANAISLPRRVGKTK